MLKDVCTVTVTDFAVYPPPFVEMVKNVKRPVRQRLQFFMEKLRRFDISAVRKDVHLYPIENKTSTAAKRTGSCAQRPFSLISIIDSAERDVKKVADFMKARLK